MNEVWDSNFGQGGWNLRFSRGFNDWELDLIGDLLTMLRFRISFEEESVFWKGGENGKFGVKEAYNLLIAPNEFAFFFFFFTWGKILTLDRLQKRGWQLPNCCFLCGCEEETVNHIFLHCIVVRVLWEIIFALFGIQWVFSETVKDVLFSLRVLLWGKKGKRFGIPFRCVSLDGLEGNE